MRPAAPLLALTLALAGPTGLSAETRTVTLDAVKGAATVAELTALGAHRVTSAEFRSRIVGRTMDEGGWTWIIFADGTHESASKDGSWTDSGGTWALEGDRYCRESPGNPRACSDVYMIGDYLRVAGPDGALAGWTVKVPQ